MVRGVRAPLDGVTVLSVYVVLVFALPSNYVVGPIGAAGSPANLLGIGMLGWWIARRLARAFPASPASQPVRKALIFFVVAVLASYVAAFMRPIDGIEASAANRGLLGVASWLGVALIAGDEIRTRARLETLTRRVVMGGGLVAALGVLQFFTKTGWTNYLLLPGLKENSEALGVIARSGFARPAGTALHPIEFGVTVSMMLPLALHFAVSDRNAGKLRRFFPIGAIGLAIPLSVSRSAILCTATALIVMLPVLGSRIRRIVGVVGVFLMGVVYVAVPGMLGTIISLLTGISGDNSAKSRTDSYSLAAEIISHAPAFGRGFYTFLPAYRILDNQYLVSLIEMGFFGLIALLVLFITGIRTAWVTRSRSFDANSRQLSQALMASVAAGAVSFAFFDAFAFPMVVSLMFLLLGAIGAQHRLTRQMPATGQIPSLAHLGRV